MNDDEDISLRYFYVYVRPREGRQISAVLKS